MKRSKLSKIAGASVLALSLTILPSTLPAAAQNNPNIDRSGPTVDTTPFQETKDDNNNWGWLGLIGLIGLANLFRKEPERVVNHDRDDAVAGPGPRM
ncbi:WGxxGxxG family protein [Argonema antarcticum]|uniref:WGxxGxxG family protein n=1 Tax=Argonema antarcticum TaxID=2942763 RepID=UPI0020136C79|nr:WGxxGxxG family protein [Argonema antarcticum]MCL1471762.1 WGxxGxxG-CTERM domain-containing protein [Argonema antarcticum A004/B2]